MVKQAGASKHQHIGTPCSPSAFRLLCQSFEAAHATLKDRSVPSSMSMRSTRRRRGRNQKSIDCCLSQAQVMLGCKVTSPVEEVLRASEPVIPVPRCEAPPAPCCGLSLQ